MTTPSDPPADDRRLAQSESHYLAMVEGAEDFAIITLDDAGIITGWNSGAERLLGHAEEQAIGRPGAIFFTPEDRARGQPDHEMSRAQSTGRAVDERWHLRQDGSRFWGSGLMMQVEGEGFLKIFRDRTAEHEADAAVRASEARYRALFERIEAGFCVIDLLFDAGGRPCDYRFVEANPAFEAQAGFGDPVGRLMRDIVPDHEQHWFDLYGQVAVTGEPARFRTRRRRARPLVRDKRLPGGRARAAPRGRAVH